MNPYTGELLGDGALGAQAFFGAMRGWHRWFNVGAEDRAPWRAITGVSNLAFLFLLFSGIYLWLPRVFKWAAFRSRLLFGAHAVRGHARDYNWHHVFGAWSVLPLIVVVATATVFSYSWAGDLVYRAFGEEPPGRRAAAAQPDVAAQPNVAAHSLDASAAPPLAALLDVAANRFPGWRSITLELPDPLDNDVSFTIDQGDGGQPQLRHSLTLDAATGEVVEWAPFESQSPGQQARRWVRYLHTGEALGLVGQTVAGIVSLTSVIMVWTGLALAYRRLIGPLLGKRKRRPA